MEFTSVPIIYSLTYKLLADLGTLIPQCAKLERESMGLPPKPTHSIRENIEKKEEEEKAVKADKSFLRKQRRKKETLSKAESQVSAHDIQEIDKKLEEEYKQRLMDKVRTIVRETVNKFVDFSHGMPKKEKLPDPPKEEIPVAEIQIDKQEEKVIPISKS